MPATQKTINTLYDGKGIRLDVYLNDNEGTVYNVEMEVEHMTLLQKDRENIELGHIEDTISATKILKLHNKGMNNESIALSLQLDIEYVNSFISDYEND